MKVTNDRVELRIKLTVISDISVYVQVDTAFQKLIIYTCQTPKDEKARVMGRCRGRGR